MLSGISRKRRMRSNPYWFTEFCNSQCLSHFAAPFIVVRAETSVAESCMEALADKLPAKNLRHVENYVVHTGTSAQPGMHTNGAHPLAERRPGTRRRWIRPQPATTPLPHGELQEAYNPHAGIPHQQVHMKRLDACE